MVNVEYLDGPALHRWLTRAVAELVARRAEINKLNVFPVPDADTGSNMAHTMEAALAEVNSLPAAHQCDITKLTAAIAVGAVKAPWQLRHGAEPSSPRARPIRSL